MCVCVCVCERERERERELNFILRMKVLGCSLIFQPVLLACTYNIDAIITLQKKIDREREREIERD